MGANKADTARTKSLAFLILLAGLGVGRGLIGEVAIIGWRRSVNTPRVRLGRARWPRLHRDS